MIGSVREGLGVPVGPLIPDTSMGRTWDNGSTTVRWDHIECVAVRSSCSPRAPGRSTFMEVSP